MGRRGALQRATSSRSSDRITRFVLRGTSRRKRRLGVKQGSISMKKSNVSQLLAALLLSTACVSEVVEGTDGNTHWVKCSAQMPCDEGTCSDGKCVVQSRPDLPDASAAEP